MDENQQSWSDESHSEDDEVEDEDGWKLTEEVEKEFYKTLSRIKNKDPKIYKKDVEFFKDVSIPEEKQTKTEKSNPMTLRDYERKIILEKGGEFSDEDNLQENLEKHREPTYAEEQESLKNSLKAALYSDSGDESDDCGGLLKRREKTEENKAEEEESYKEWLNGQKSDVPDEEVQTQMKPLQEYWTNPNLDQEEQFLRDYVLNKKYLENDENKHRYNLEELDDETETVQEEFSHRFEEPDQEFIKRYPRQMETTLRRGKDHRKLKRSEVKERKQKEKEKKMVQIKLKKKLKKKEIEEKLEQLKKLTGNDQLAFESVLDKDFDFDEHDKAMQRLFSEDFYTQDDPNFAPTGSAVDEEAWNENWYEDPSGSQVEENEELHCEDPNFNMDCDYDPTQEKPIEKTSRSRRRKDKHRRTTLSEVVNKEKPLFDPSTHKSFQEYVDQYYAIDCEDFIGDLPCRFKYRRTVPNSFGLTIEEILAADEKELERWCSIKRIHQLRPENKEKGDVKVFKKKAADEELKRKILPSLFKVPEETNIDSAHQKKNHHNKHSVVDVNEPDKQSSTVEDAANSTESNVYKNKKKNKNKQKNNFTEVDRINSNKLLNNRKRKLEEKGGAFAQKKKKKVGNSFHYNLKKNQESKPSKYNEKSKEDSTFNQMSDARLLAYGIKPKKFRNKLKYSKNKI